NAHDDEKHDGPPARAKEERPAPSVGNGPDGLRQLGGQRELLRLVRRADRRRLDGSGDGDSSRRVPVADPGDASRPPAAAPVQAPVLGKEVMHALSARNPDKAASPRLLSALQLALSQKRSDRLRRRSEGSCRFSHREVVHHLGKTLAQPGSPSETFWATT